MRKYKHWLVLDKMDKDKIKALELVNELVKYQKEREVEIELYHRDSGTFEHIFSVESTQHYNELELPCDSLSNSFKKLAKKPKSIHKGRSFDDYAQRYNLA